MARVSRGRLQRTPSHHHAGQDLRGENPLTPPADDIEIRLSRREASILHATLEDILENGDGNPELEKAYRLLGWKTLAARDDATGLTGRLADIAKKADTLEDFEAARDAELGPIIDRLESPENRDP